MFDVFLRQVHASAIFSVCALLAVYPLVAALLVRNRLPARLARGTPDEALLANLR